MFTGEDFIMNSFDHPLVFLKGVLMHSRTRSHLQQHSLQTRGLAMNMKVLRLRPLYEDAWKKSCLSNFVAVWLLSFCVYDSNALHRELWSFSSGSVTLRLWRGDSSPMAVPSASGVAATRP